MAAADLVAYSGYAKSYLDLIQESQEGPVQILVDAGADQMELHSIAKALYSHKLSLDYATVEPICRAAHYLQMPVVVDACADYYCKHVEFVGQEVRP